jgi:hypothetical protein
VDENPEDWHPGHDVEEGTGPSGDLETDAVKTGDKPKRHVPDGGGSQGAAGAGGPSPEPSEE